MMCVCFTFYIDTISNLQKKRQEQYKEFSYTIHPETSSFMDCLSQWKRVKLKELVPQSYLTLCEPTVCSPPGSSVQGILQARILEWVAISFSNAWKWKVKVKSFSRVWLLATPWTAAYQAPPSMGFSRQEYWSGVPLPSPIKEGYTI